MIGGAPILDGIGDPGGLPVTTFFDFDGDGVAGDRRGG